jgi:tripartite-type tricarboxylate transporter receptor subunit TctC
MKSFSRRSVLAAGIAGIALSMGLTAHAEDKWPTKPVTLVVPFAPGGTTDILARIVGKKMGEMLHQAFIIENKPGAGGTIAANYVAHAKKDGYTYLMATVSLTMAPAVYRDLPYDFARDLDPVGMVASTPNVLLVNPSVPVKTVPELIAYLKAHPGKVNFGSAGNGSTEHFSGALFRSMTGTDITHVPYKGGAPMMIDLIGGQIQMAIETSPSAFPYVQSGKVRALAVTSTNPSPTYPGVPTLDQAGVPGYDVSTWFALMAPHGTPVEEEKEAHEALAAAVGQTDVRELFKKQGVTAGNMQQDKLAGFVKSEAIRWAKVAKEAGLEAN